MNSININERLEAAAESGAKSISLFVWNRTAKKLQESGVILTPTAIPGRPGEKYYDITWKDATVDDLPDDWVLNDYIKVDHQPKLSQAQILWLIAEDAIRSQKK